MYPRVLAPQRVLLILLAAVVVHAEAIKPPGVDSLHQGLHVFPVRASRVSYSPSHAGYPATDIFCPEGSEFVAPVSGVIHFVRLKDEWKPEKDDPAARGGLAVAMIGDDGWRYYGSHLSAVQAGLVPGTRVMAGDRLGLTGGTGNARGRPSHLHFGISVPSAPDDWKARRGQVDPFPHLERWRHQQAVVRPK